MALFNIIAFVVFKIRYNLVLMQKLSFTNNCWYTKIQKNPQRNITFICNALSETVNGFV